MPLSSVVKEWRASRLQDKRKCPRQPRSGSPVAEASFGLCVRGHRLWQCNRNASLLACPNLFAVEVTAVGDGVELLHAQRRLGLVGHMGELRSVSPVVGYLMHDDQMMAVGLWRRVPLNARLLVDELSKKPF